MEPKRVYSDVGLDAGYARLKAESAPDAVAWWFWRSFDDGFAFARGGYAKTAREARHEIAGLYDFSHRAHRAWQGRPMFRLTADGLIPLDA